MNCYDFSRESAGNPAVAVYTVLRRNLPQTSGRNRTGRYNRGRESSNSGFANVSTC